MRRWTDASFCLLMTGRKTWIDLIRHAMIVDERDQVFDRQSISVRAKHTDAVRRISFACRSSRFSHSRAFSFADMSDVTPARFSASTSAFLCHSASKCAAQSIFDDIDTIVCQRDGYSSAYPLHQPHRPIAHLGENSVRRLAHHSPSS
jgi:hypothetical protein